MKFSYILEAIILWVAFQLFRMMGADTASAVGGWIGRTIGPRIGASRKASINLEKSFPDLSQQEHAAHIGEMWENLGRVVAEYPHLKYIANNKVDVTGRENLEALGVEKPFIMIGAHLANWEVIHATTNDFLQYPCAYIVREPNNPFAAKLLERCRNFGHKGRYLPKSSAGTRELVKTIQDGKRIGVLIDQKYNEGEPIEFLGRPAMTSTAVGQLALKYDVPILPIQIVRENSRFRLIIHPPLDITGMDKVAIMLTANKLIEGWIRQHPGQWLWLHRRWDSKALQ